MISIYRTCIACLLFIVVFGIACTQQSSETTITPIIPSSSYDKLIILFHEFREFEKPVITDGVPNYTPDAIRSQRLGLVTMLERLNAINFSD